MTSIKQLDGFAYNLAQKFAVSCEHILFLMHEQELDEFRADLLTGAIQPESLNIERNRILIGYIQTNYEKLMRHFPQVDIAQACLTLRLKRLKGSESRLQSQIRVALMAEDGREWTGAMEVDDPLLAP